MPRQAEPSTTKRAPRTPYFPMQNCIMGWKARGCWGLAGGGLMCTWASTREDPSVSCASVEVRSAPATAAASTRVV
jgi:hypothetical protein